MNPTKYLGVLSLGLAIAVVPSSGQIVLSFDSSTTTYSSLGPNQDVAIRLRNDSGAPVFVYGGGIYVEIGTGTLAASTVPIIQGFNFFSSDPNNPFREYLNGSGNTVIVSEEGGATSRFRGLSFMVQDLNIPVQIPTGADFVFATARMDSSQASPGSWSLRMGGFSSPSPQGDLETYLNTPSAGDTYSPTLNAGTFSAVPEPEETMAVMAGVSLGLGWWIRRRRSKTPQPKG